MPGRAGKCREIREKLHLLDFSEKLQKRVGVDDGTRTRDNWNHNPGLYQLSYVHHCLNDRRASANLARPARLELTTPGLEGRCSIRLSYGRLSRRISCSQSLTPLLVGVRGFEPPTSWSQTRRATGLRYTPKTRHSTRGACLGQLNQRAGMFRLRHPRISDIKAAFPESPGFKNG
jgi:hypothetical protein